MKASDMLRSNNGLKTTQSVLNKQQSGVDAAQKVAQTQAPVFTQQQLDAAGKKVDQMNAATPQNETPTMKAAREKTIATQQAIANGVDVNQSAPNDEEDKPSVPIVKKEESKPQPKQLSYADMYKMLPRQHQWFGMLKYDPQSLRTQPQTSVTQIFKIYQKAAASIDLCAQNINVFIDKLQQKYNIDNSHTYLIGFSQGAMLTIYTSISRSHTIGGAFALSGLAAGRKLLATKITARPKLYLFHGLDDLKVQYKTVKSTVQWLKRHNMQPKVFTYAGLTHHVTALELEKICSIINNTTQKL